MRKAGLFLWRKIKKYKLFILFFSIVLILSIINIAETSPGRIGGDTVSMVLMATAPLRGLGAPYKDFWEYKPPGVFLLLGVWIRLFGDSMASFKLLQFLFLLGTGGLTYLILKKIFSSFYVLIVGGLAIIVLFSPYLFSIFLTSELFGLFFSLAGLVSLMYLKKFELRFFLSSFLFILSAQMKDPFSFTILAILPLLIYLLMSRDYRDFLKAIVLVAAGFLSAVFLTGGYLLILGSLNDYFQVWACKSRVFNLWKNWEGFEERFDFSFQHAKNILIFSQYRVLTILALWISSFSLRLKMRSFNAKNHGKLQVLADLKIKLKPQTLDILIVVFYSLGSFMGFTMTDRFGPHYLLQVVLPIYFFWAIICKSILDNFQNIIRNRGFTLLLSIPLFMIVLFPKAPYVTSYRLEKWFPPHTAEQISRVLTTSKVDAKLEDYIAEKTSPTSCVLSVYGWGAGEIYYYAQRRPCTRFFLVNIVVEEWQKKEYRESILQNPPQAIVYTQGGADMEVAQFEKEVVNLARIIDQCYQPDPQYTGSSMMHPTLYFPRYQSDELKACLRENAS